MRVGVHLGEEPAPGVRLGEQGDRRVLRADDRAGQPRDGGDRPVVLVVPRRPAGHRVEPREDGQQQERRREAAERDAYAGRGRAALQPRQGARQPQGRRRPSSPAAPAAGCSARRRPSPARPRTTAWPREDGEEPEHAGVLPQRAAVRHDPLADQDEEQRRLEQELPDGFGRGGPIDRDTPGGPRSCSGRPRGRPSAPGSRRPSPPAGRGQQDLGPRRPPAAQDQRDQAARPRRAKTVCLKKKPMTRQAVPSARATRAASPGRTPSATTATVASIRAVMSGRFSRNTGSVRWLTPRSAAQATDGTRPSPSSAVQTAISVTVASAETRVRTRPDMLFGPTQRKISPWTQGTRRRRCGWNGRPARPRKPAGPGGSARPPRPRSPPRGCAGPRGHQSGDVQSRDQQIVAAARSSGARKDQCAGPGLRHPAGCISSMTMPSIARVVCLDECPGTGRTPVARCRYGLGARRSRRVGPVAAVERGRPRRGRGCGRSWGSSSLSGGRRRLHSVAL